MRTTRLTPFAVLLLLPACADEPRTDYQEQAGTLAECGSDERPWEPLTKECPAPGACLSIDTPDVYDLNPDCSYDAVEIQIRSSDVVLDCHGATFNDNLVTGADVAIWVAGYRHITMWYPPSPWPYAYRPYTSEWETFCQLTEEPLENVEVRNCVVNGYEVGAKVSLEGTGGDPGGYADAVFDEWHRHPNEREHQWNQIDHCLRWAAPRNIRFRNMILRGARENGFHITNSAHDVSFVGGEISDAGRDLLHPGSGCGVYMSPGTRNNRIENVYIHDNDREAVALDGSALNTIIGNRIASNGMGVRNDYNDYYGAGVTLFRNAGENGNGRNQHAFDNVIQDNVFSLQEIGVWVGYRQGKPYPEGERADPIYFQDSEGRNYKKYAENTHVIGNRFHGLHKGVVLQDGTAEIVGNLFIHFFEPSFPNTTIGIEIGHDVRMNAGEPVRANVITDNVLSDRHATAIAPRDCTYDNFYENNYIAPCTHVSNCTSTAGTPVEIPRPQCERQMASISTHDVGPTGGWTPGPTGRRGFFGTDHVWFAGNIDNEGPDDIVDIFTTTDGRIRIWINRVIDGAIDYQTSFQTFEPLPSGHLGQWVSGDFDGDGRIDLAHVHGDPTAGGGTYAAFYLARGLGFQRYMSRIITPVWYVPTDRWMAGDIKSVNGVDDGRDELVVLRQGWQPQVQVWSSPDGLNYTSTGWTVTGTGAAVDQQQWRLADLTGDGLDDLIEIENNGGLTRVTVARSTGTSFAPGQVLTYVNGLPPTFSMQQRWFAMDWSGDGIDDIVVLHDNGGTTRVWRSTSTGGNWPTLAFAGTDNLGIWVPTHTWTPGRMTVPADPRVDLVRIKALSWPQQ